MKKFIKVLLLMNDSKTQEIIFESLTGLHELEIYTALEKIFPAYIYVDYNVDIDIFQEGYNIIYKNGLDAVVIYKAN